MRRHNLQTAAVIVGLTLFVVAAGLLFSSLARDGTERPERPRIDITALQPGYFIEQKLEVSRVFVLRDLDGQIHVFTVPFWDGAYWLPEFDWSLPAIACADFGPDTTEGKLIEDGAFRCRLPHYGEFFRREHSWSYSGENLGYRTADMKIAEHEVEQNVVLLPHW